MPYRETQLRKRLTRAFKAKRAAIEECHAAIVAAHEGGMSSRRIGEWVGLTHTRVLEIIHDVEAER